MSSVLKETTEVKMTSVTTLFKKLTTGNNVFIVSIDCHITQFLHQMFNVSASLLDDALKPATPLSNVVINETLDISHGSVATHLRSDGIFSDSIITNFLLILAVK